MTQTLHPDMDPVDGVALLTAAAHGDAIDVTGITSLAAIRTVQAIADAADTCIWWLHDRNKPVAVVIIDRPTP